MGYKSGIGFYLVNGTGWTLYFRTTNKSYNGTSTCTSTGCTTNWQALYTSKPTLPPGLNASSFGTITLASGSKQLTYDGYPLYYWHTDTQAGQTNGQGVGNFYACTVPTPTANVTAPSRLITLTPNSGPVGTTVTITGSNFLPSATITITFDSTTVASTTSFGTGAFSVSFQVPSSAAARAHTVTAADNGDSAQSIFTVT